MNFLFLLILIAILSTTPQEGAQTKVEKVEDLLEVNLDISSTYTSIHLANVTLSEYGTIYFFLSNQNAKFNYEDILEGVSESKNSPFVRAIEYSNSNVSVTFSNLQSNVSYYLYCFGESYLGHRRSGIKTMLIQTKTQKKFSTQMMSSHFDKVCTLFIPIFFILSIISFCKNIEEKRTAEMNTPQDHFDCCDITENNIKCSNQTHLRDDNQIFLRCKRFIINLFQNSINEEIRIPHDQAELKCVSKALEGENKEFEDQKTCGICCERPREVIFLSCGHIYCCVKCSLKINICPIDQKPIYIKYRYQVCDRFGIFDNFDAQEKSRGFLNDTIDALIQLCNAQNAFSSIMSLRKNQSSMDEKYVELKLKNERYKNYFQCIGCNQRKKDVIFNECGHFVYCNSCAHDLKECPFDHIAISQTLNAYIS
jgi:hypothetical protein